jgi:probable rRNA maturation factor
VDAPSIEVAIACEAWTDACPDAAAIAGRAVEAALADAADPERFIVDVTLTDNAEQRRLNRTYRGKDAPTNVLSFPQGASETAHPDAPVLLGDVVLAFETVRREAAEQQKTLADHLSHLVVHGVLHLLGFDHEKAHDAAEMELRELSILAGLGVPDPYRGIMWQETRTTF